MHCHRCEAVNPNDATYCHACGALLKAIHCHQCEAVNPGGAAYCSSCGALLKKCPNCGEKMVEARASVGGILDRSRAYVQNTTVAEPSWHSFHKFGFGPGQASPISYRVHVCYECGMVMFFVDDPAIFRPPTGTETLPRPVSGDEPSSENLPRSTSE